MCGLYGYDAPGLSVVERTVLCAHLAHANDSRGGQAWGVVTGAGEITKGLGNAGAEAWRIADAAPSLAGHTRWATHGDAKDLGNAHPFTHGRVVGMHNGVFYNHAVLNAKHGRTFAVDSQHIFESLSTGTDTSDIEGYGVIVWREAGTDGFFLCKLTDRGEIAVGSIGEKNAPKVTAWSSTKEALKAALASLGDAGKITYWEVETGQVYHVVKGKFWQITGREIKIAAGAGLSWSDFGKGGKTLSYFSGRDDDDTEEIKEKIKNSKWWRKPKDAKPKTTPKGVLEGWQDVVDRAIESCGLTWGEVARYVAVDGIESMAEALVVSDIALSAALTAAGFEDEVEVGEEIDAARFKDGIVEGSEEWEAIQREEEGRFTEALME